ncbi:beta-barrel fold lipoprotein [Wenyingzhuangia aestuarii]|uniref:beta-barrel fold lipoprotein n=1 Tax=Wenyingzhuangia aestuarii TaxID=1647582 RepID=UPI00143A2F4B|nr:hypothetical protein [Wenyingzhuangia aestuarii]NJB83128.1 hypothetical protein [Wenyingzhuangia aestuarii]
MKKLLMVLLASLAIVSCEKEDELQTKNGKTNDFVIEVSQSGNLNDNYYFLFGHSVVQSQVTFVDPNGDSKKAGFFTNFEDLPEGTYKFTTSTDEHFLITYTPGMLNNNDTSVTWSLKVFKNGELIFEDGGILKDETELKQRIHNFNIEE